MEGGVRASKEQIPRKKLGFDSGSRLRRAELWSFQKLPRRGRGQRVDIIVISDSLSRDGILGGISYRYISHNESGCQEDAIGDTNVFLTNFPSLIALLISLRFSLIECKHDKHPKSGNITHVTSCYSRVS